jgi:hypothetical protein
MIENKKAVIVTFIILILIIAGLVGFIVLERVLMNKKIEEPTTVMIGEVEIRPESFYQVYNTLERFDRAFNYEDSKYFGYVYKKRKIEIDKFDSTIALYAALRADMKATQEQKIIPESLVKAEFEAMYGENLKYEAKEIEKGDNFDISYNKTTGYTYVSNDIVQSYTPGIMTINSKTAVENGKIIVTRKVFYVEYVKNDAGVPTMVTIYNDMNKSQKLGKIDIIKKGINQEELLGKFSSKISTYNFIFKQNAKDNNFALSRIERIK